jgi:hypothetical protein
LTVPIVDYVAADRNGGGDVRNSGSNYLTTRFRQNRAHQGLSALVTPPNTTDSFVYQDEFVAWVKDHSSGVPVIISLDNEPDLWSDTHPEVHPAALDLRRARHPLHRPTPGPSSAAWPDVPVTGFVSYGWNGYITLQNASDRAGKGEFIDYFPQAGEDRRWFRGRPARRLPRPALVPGGDRRRRAHHRHQHQR